MSCNIIMSRIRDNAFTLKKVRDHLYENAYSTPIDLNKLLKTLPDKSYQKLLEESTKIQHAKDNPSHHWSGHEAYDKIHYHLRFFTNSKYPFEHELSFPTTKIEDIYEFVKERLTITDKIYLCISPNASNIPLITVLKKYSTLTDYIISNNVKIITLDSDKMLIEYPEVDFHDETQLNPILVFTESEYKKLIESKSKSKSEKRKKLLQDISRLNKGTNEYHTDDGLYNFSGGKSRKLPRRKPQRNLTIRTTRKI